MFMELIVFCHASEAYFVPKKLADKLREADKAYENGDVDAIKIGEEMKKKYKPKFVFHLFTGNI